MKITKSELKEMIREALREELSKNAETDKEISNRSYSEKEKRLVKNLVADREISNKSYSKSNELEEAYTPFSFDFETEVDYYGAVYCARTLVYSMVNDPRSATRLYNRAVKEGSDHWNEDEFPALCDLIGDALEAANYHEYVDDYMRSNYTFPYWDSFKASASDKAKIDNLIASCKTSADRLRVLWEAINAALYRY